MTIAEIQAAVAKEPKLLLDIISSFKDNTIERLQADGHIIRTADEDTAHIAAQVEQLLPGKITEGVNKAYGESMVKIDKLIAEITGVPKTGVEKTTDYAKRAIAAIKAKSGKEKDGEGGENPVDKQRIADLEQQVNEWTEKYTTLESKSAEDLQEFALGNELANRKIAVPAYITDEKDKQDYIAREKKLIATGVKIAYKGKKNEKGELVYYNSEGVAQISKQDGKPLTYKEILDQEYGNKFLPEEKKQKGSGAEQDGSGGDGKMSRDSAHKSLAAKGLQAGTKEYIQELSKLTSEGKISD
jgi:hypothetical protein